MFSGVSSPGAFGCQLGLDLARVEPVRQEARTDGARRATGGERRSWREARGAGRRARGAATPRSSSGACDPARARRRRGGGTDKSRRPDAGGAGRARRRAHQSRRPKATSAFVVRGNSARRPLLRPRPSRRSNPGPQNRPRALSSSCGAGPPVRCPCSRPPPRPPPSSPSCSLSAAPSSSQGACFSSPRARLRRLHGRSSRLERRALACASASLAIHRIQAHLLAPRAARSVWNSPTPPRGARELYLRAQGTAHP